MLRNCLVYPWPMSMGWRRKELRSSTEDCPWHIAWHKIGRHMVLCSLNPCRICVFNILRVIYYVSVTYAWHLHALVLSHIIASRVGETTAQITPTVRDQKK